MANRSPAASRSLSSHLDAALQQIRPTRMDAPTQWHWWTTMCTEWELDPWLRQCTQPQRNQSILAFAAAIRAGRFHSRPPVGSQTIEKAVRTIAQRHAAAFLPDPRCLSDISLELHPDLCRLYRSYRESDPATRPQKPLSLKAIIWLTTVYPKCAPDPTAQRLYQAIADLSLLAFFFLLRVSEYTKPQRSQQRTVPLRRKDIRLWHHGHALSDLSDYQSLSRATAVTISLDNQKNGRRSEAVTHPASQHQCLCPVRTMAQRLYQLALFPPDTPIYTVPNSPPSAATHVTSSMMRSAIRLAVTATMSQDGFNPADFGTHSLRVTGALALHAAGYDESTIKRIGRWSSNTYLRYISPQVAATLDADLSQNMLQSLDLRPTTQDL